ncbi:hypothetical protein HDU87_001317 [Geranomyces variabilis]|uniref:Uncharacterized protein n=1 Tax=Geranomyces variabilis TaxID=109894 RepID=A0AAD5TMP7_9FUNG|nr:hypothetical protein HDU87_001317 [Geranomyces variabilis]
MAKGGVATAAEGGSGVNRPGTSVRKWESRVEGPWPEDVKFGPTTSLKLKPEAKPVKVNAGPAEEMPRKVKNHHRQRAVGKDDKLALHSAARPSRIVANEELKRAAGLRKLPGRLAEGDRNGKDLPVGLSAAAQSTIGPSNAGTAKKPDPRKCDRLLKSDETRPPKALRVWSNAAPQIVSVQSNGRAVRGSDPLKSDRSPKEDLPSSQSAPKIHEMHHGKKSPFGSNPVAQTTSVQSGASTFKALHSMKRDRLSERARPSSPPARMLDETRHDEDPPVRLNAPVQMALVQSNPGASIRPDKMKQDRSSGQCVPNFHDAPNVEITAFPVNVTIDDRRPASIKQKLEDTYERGLKILQMSELEVLRAERDAYVKAYRQAEGERKFLVRHVQGAGMSAARATASLDPAQLQADLESCLDAAIAEDVAASARYSSLIGDLRTKLERASEQISVLTEKLAQAASRQRSDAAKMAEQASAIKGLTRLLAESQASVVRLDCKTMRSAGPEPCLQTQDSGIDVYNSASEISLTADCDVLALPPADQPVIGLPHETERHWISMWDTDPTIFVHPFL